MKFPPAKSPKAKKIAHTQTRFGVSWTDDYAWMKDENWQAVMADGSKLNTDIRAHLETENAYTETVLSPLKSLETTIFEEMKGRLEPTASSVPLPDGLFEYFHQYAYGDQHGRFVRRPRGEKVVTTLLDCETRAKDTKFYDIGDVSHSPDHQWVAFSEDLTGSENYTVRLRHIETGEMRDTAIERSAGGLVWANDNETLFWVERDDNHRPYAVFRQNVFDDTAKAELVYQESDPGFFVSHGLSDDRRFIEISAHNHTTSEIHRIPVADPTADPICFLARRTGHEYSLSQSGERIFILSNHGGATDFAIYETTAEATDPSEWSVFEPHQSGRLIIGLESFSEHLVWMERKDALPRIVVHQLSDAERYSVEMEDDAYSLGLLGGYEFDTSELHFSYASPSRPTTTYRFDMALRRRDIIKEQQVPSGHVPEDYAVKRLNITARDGETVPVTLLHKAGIDPDGSAPLLLYGYGSYGITIPASFRTSILSLVDRGFVYAIAHIRGGMAKGYQGYLDGKLEKKPNTFNDFVDAGRALVEQGWTSRGRIVAHGGSAGGLLVGAALNQDPALFGGVIGAVPFVDVLNTMSDTNLPLTPPEWPEWGNPIEDEAAFTNILSWSPYDNIVDADYPPVFITGGLSDPRVTYWEPAKWAARLRGHQTGDAPILLKINMSAGHQGESGRYDSLKETAQEYAFALACVGLSGAN